MLDALAIARLAARRPFFVRYALIDELTATVHDQTLKDNFSQGAYSILRPPLWHTIHFLSSELRFVPSFANQAQSNQWYHRLNQLSMENSTPNLLAV